MLLGEVLLFQRARAGSRDYRFAGGFAIDVCHAT